MNCIDFFLLLLFSLIHNFQSSPSYSLSSSMIPMIQYSAISSRMIDTSFVKFLSNNTVISYNSIRESSAKNISPSSSSLVTSLACAPDGGVKNIISDIKAKGKNHEVEEEKVRVCEYLGWTRLAAVSALSQTRGNITAALMSLQAVNSTPVSRSYSYPSLSLPIENISSLFNPAATASRHNSSEDRLKEVADTNNKTKSSNNNFKSFSTAIKKTNERLNIKSRRESERKLKKSISGTEYVKHNSSRTRSNSNVTSGRGVVVSASNGPDVEEQRKGAEKEVEYESITSVTHLTSLRDLQSLVLSSPVPVLLQLYAPWCEPCRRLGPLLDTLVTAINSNSLMLNESYQDTENDCGMKGNVLRSEMKERVRLVKVNIDTAKALVARSVLDVKQLPTLLVVHRGRIQKRVVGFPSLPDVQELLGALVTTGDVADAAEEQSRGGYSVGEYSTLSSRLAHFAGMYSLTLADRSSLRSRVRRLLAFLSASLPTEAPLKQRQLVSVQLALKCISAAMRDVHSAASTDISSADESVAPLFAPCGGREASVGVALLFAAGYVICNSSSLSEPEDKYVRLRLSHCNVAILDIVQEVVVEVVNKIKFTAKPLAPPLRLKINNPQQQVSFTKGKNVMVYPSYHKNTNNTNKLLHHPSASSGLTRSSGNTPATNSRSKEAIGKKSVKYSKDQNKKPQFRTANKKTKHISKIFMSKMRMQEV